VDSQKQARKIGVLSFFERSKLVRPNVGGEKRETLDRGAVRFPIPQRSSYTIPREKRPRGREEKKKERITTKKVGICTRTKRTNDTTTLKTRTKKERDRGGGEE